MATIQDVINVIGMVTAHLGFPEVKRGDDQSLTCTISYLCQHYSPQFLTEFVRRLVELDNFMKAENFGSFDEPTRIDYETELKGKSLKSFNSLTAWLQKQEGFDIIKREEVCDESGLNISTTIQHSDIADK